MKTNRSAGYGKALQPDPFGMAYACLDTHQPVEIIFELITPLDQNVVWGAPPESPGRRRPHPTSRPWRR
jgi:hypothetical protein